MRWHEQSMTLKMTWTTINDLKDDRQTLTIYDLKDDRQTLTIYDLKNDRQTLTIYDLKDFNHNRWHEQSKCMNNHSVMNNHSIKKKSSVMKNQYYKMRWTKE